MTATRLILVALLACCTLLCAWTALPERLQIARYPWGEHAFLRLQAPAAWQVSYERFNGTKPWVRFEPPVGAPTFQVVFRPHDFPTPEPARMRLIAEVQASYVAGHGQHIVKPVVPFGAGCCFSATDLAPQKDEGKYSTTCTVPLGPSMLSFAILTNDGQEAVVAQALQVLRSAAWEAAP